ncbi:NAD(P)-binding domain-containing protein [Tianweitania sp. BSSL-BM11]|uniref:NAD(P)-binding domain-containing protein n=1 Tax=Tianweitania aestuarii TaxID=2814886 RepID=A0ABS5RWW8_9HYPH|nr:NAD(P)-binding domain-containing protein [Tianweitania aestuarii]MBS9721492.1 NAD(P)-binding domain-containing protein [Tianweitania aestuarii]
MLVPNGLRRTRWYRAPNFTDFPKPKGPALMKIGLLGTGNIGRTLARKLPAAGHDLKIANSRGPDTIDADMLGQGARAVTAEEALADVDVAILSIPFNALPKIKHLIDTLPEDVVVIDTSNYYPGRDGKIAEIDAGQIESEWVGEQIGRSVVKAWNAIGCDSFATKAKPKGAPRRIAIPVAGDRKDHREVAIALVEDTGFDGYDAGTLAGSWRQQPAAPAYTTDLTSGEMGPALAAAERDRLPMRRDLTFALVMERLGEGVPPDAEWGLKLSRAINM